MGWVTKDFQFIAGRDKFFFLFQCVQTSSAANQAFCLIVLVTFLRGKVAVTGCCNSP
jgi:hypothetical protein